MSKRDRAYKRSARVEAERARKETEKMIKRMKKDQFRWQSEKVMKKILLIELYHK